MLDGTEFFECQCGADGHVLKIIKSKDPEDPEVYVTMFLEPDWPWWKRIGVAVRYLLGWAPKRNPFAVCIVRPEDFRRARDLFQEMHDFVEGE